MTEQWKSIQEFAGMYEVSNLGRVRSLRKKEPLIMATHINNNGYLIAKFKINQKTHNRLVHRLVAYEFCDGYKEGLVVNHIDGNRLNNAASNLEWITTKENIHDCIKRGTFNVKAAHAVAHEKRKRKVQQLDENGSVINTFESARAAGAFIGIHENCISRVCRGGRNKAAGYSWKYENS